MNNQGNKIAEIPLNDLNEIVTALKNCRKDKEKLIEAINFLNEEIKKYNKNYADKINNKIQEIVKSIS